MAPVIERPSFDQGVILFLSFALWETHKAYREAAPPISELRTVEPGSDEFYSTRQHLVDTDITIGIVALTGAIIAAFMMRRWEPVAITAATLALLSGYHHSILGSPTV